MAAKIGLDAAIYIGSGGTSSGATYTTPMKNIIGDLTVSLEYSEGEISSRGGAFELFKPTMGKVEIAFECLWDEADTNDFAKILTAWKNKSVLNIKCLSSATGAGIEGEFYCFKLERIEEIKGPIKCSVVLKPTYVLRYPTWVDGT
jgi:hypothetical protein